MTAASSRRRVSFVDHYAIMLTDAAAAAQRTRHEVSSRTNARKRPNTLSKQHSPRPKVPKRPVPEGLDLDLDHVLVDAPDHDAGPDVGGCPR